jgi:nicotinamide phosphoribosyltransferase
MLNNIILKTDSYKQSHYLQYPPGTERVYSYIESRGGKFDKMVFFGIQAFIKEYLLKPVTKEDVDVAEKLVTAHGFTFNRKGWDHIIEKHNGKLPVEIKSLREGSVIPIGIPVLTIENTDPECFWLTSFLETSLLRAVWYPSTVATISYHAKQVIYKYLQKTCDDPDAEIDFKLVDFGARGVSSGESAALGGLAHLINFKVSDTMEALVAAIEFYNAKGPVGFSIPAAEHSTVTSWMGSGGEEAAVDNMLTQFAKPGATTAIVGDSYDIYNFSSNILGKQFKQRIIDSGATIVDRPDSGVPHIVDLEVLERLGKEFGFTINSKGYKVLPKCIRVIQGDGVNLESIQDILGYISEAEWSTENIAFGMGGMLLQGMNRDTMQWAMKCSAICINEKWQDVYKDPITSSAKKSKKGRFAVVYEKGIATCKPLSGNVWQDSLQTTFKNGNLLIDEEFETIRQRAKKAFKEEV